MVRPAVTSKGLPVPLGPDVQGGGTNFALFSAHATSVTVCLFSPDGKTETDRITLTGKTGDVWHGFVKGLKAGQLYGYRVDGPYAPHEGHRFNANKLLIDPYAKNLFGEFIQDDALYGYDVHSSEKDLSFSTSDSAPYVPKSVAGHPEYDWEEDAQPNTDWRDTIIYEAHVKGFTKRLEGVVKAERGTLTGLSNPAAIRHLKDLGVTAIELLPVQSFFSEPRLTNMGLTNYWGYNPVNYFAPHNAYLGPSGTSAFQEAVKAFHEAGIEVILDVVYNHTAESWELGPTISYRGIDNASYYQLKQDRRYYVNHTGCGNTLNMAHPRVLELTIQSLRFWSEDMHVDGFRFDLAPTLARNPHDFDVNAPFFKALNSDPVLSKVKLISEPWDIGPNGYVLGQFPDDWTEWNDKFRDTVRSFWRGDAAAHQSLAGALLGSADIFDHNARLASSSINFISAHDGFSLHDTVSFNTKHNQANGENNRDGHGHNLSDNMGVEGETDNPEIISERRQRKKNMLATLLLSQGTPMMLAGDEFGHSKRGNNNAYCQDNEITWLDWASRDKALENFTKELISLRKTYAHFTQSKFLHGETVSRMFARNVEWLSPSGHVLQNNEWENPNQTCLGLALSMEGQDTIILVLNRGEACRFELPHSELELLLSTSKDIIEFGEIPAHSVCVFKNKGVYVPPERRREAITVLSEDYGIIESFRDISGTVHTASDETREKLLAAFGVYVDKPTPLETSNPAKQTQAASKVYGADKLRDEGGVWGLTAALYGLKSDRNWGVGDFEDLAVLAEIMASKGADFVGINPIHALFPSAPDLFAPYSPSSRRFLNVMCIAPDKIEDLPAKFSVDTSKLRAPELVDYKAVYAAKMKAFEAAYGNFLKLPESAGRRKDFANFAADSGQDLQNQALFDVLFENLPPDQKTYAGWRNFPNSFADPQSVDCKDFAQSNRQRIEFYAYLQWIAHTQLIGAQQRARAAGMCIGIYLDFAVGIVPGGCDAWQNKSAFAQGVTLGAPGDQANPDGQVWNLLPLNPHELTRNNFEPYRRELRRAMALGGAVRIDHILGHLRSFWTPQEGESGAYVKYPFDGLVQMIAEESQSQKCVIFGEDLGTVPDDFRKRMADYELMGCNIALIERDSDGQLIPRENIRRLSITGYSNHDFPTLSGFWNGEDFKWRENLGIGSSPDAIRWERERRDADRREFLSFARREPEDAGTMTPELMAALQAYLAGSEVLAFAVQLDDLLLEVLQPNVPGTTDEQPNWRRRSKLDLSEIAASMDIDNICKAIQSARKGHS